MIAYVFEDLYVWMLEEIQELEKKGISIQPICIRPRKSATFSKDFLGHDLFRIADRTIFLRENIMHPGVWIDCMRILIIRPVKMFRLAVQLALLSTHEFKFRDWRVFMLFPQMWSLLRSKRLTRLQVHFASYACTYAYFTHRVENLEYFVTVHAADIFLKNTLRKEKLFAAQRIMSINRYNKEFLIDLYGEDISSRVIVNYTGTDISQFCPVEHIRLEPFTIMSLAILVEHKGLRYLLEACRLLKDKQYVFKCNIYGSGPELARLEHFVNSNNLREVVTFHGIIARESVVEAFHASSVFVLPSVVASSNGLREGIPQVFKECMACGIPAISTYTGGIPEIIEDGKTGFLVHERDAEGLARKLAQMIDQPELVRQMSKTARRKIENQFNIDTHTQRMIEIMNLQSR